MAEYLMIEKDALPDYFLKVIDARRLIESGTCLSVGEAVNRVGISRSTYYKYKDKVLPVASFPSGRKAVITMMLSHEAGALSGVMACVSLFNASVLTINQALPINGKAFVTISLDTEKMTQPIDELINALENTDKAESVRLAALE